MPAKPNERLGEILHGTYRLERLLGRGGMGEVYEASHLRLVRRFAVKILKGPIAEHHDLERFRQEAQITSALGHPHIVEVIDFNELDDGSAYIVMELLEGENLADRLLREKKLNLGQAASILRQTVGALEVAHAKGVIHRDLKPANIFLCRRDDRDDYVKVVDFGISKVLGAKVALTKTSEIIGTPHYMAPEQIMSEDRTVIDQRSDVYAMATITFEMLAGNTPFSADSVPALLYRILDFPAPNVQEFREEIPEAIGRVLQMAMQKEPGSRFDSIRKFWHAFVEELRRQEDTLNSETGDQGAAAAAMKITMGPLLSPTIPPVLPSKQVPLTDQDLVPPAQRVPTGEQQSPAGESQNQDGFAHDPTMASGTRPTLATNSLPRTLAQENGALLELATTEPPVEKVESSRADVPNTLSAADDLISLRLKRRGILGTKNALLILITVGALGLSLFFYLRGQRQSAALPPTPPTKPDARAQPQTAPATDRRDSGPADLAIPRLANPFRDQGAKAKPPKRPTTLKTPKIRTSTLSVSTRFDGKIVPAYIYLDGKRVGEAPFFKSGLKPGSYRLMVRRAGFKSTFKTVILAPGKKLTTVIDLKK
jgi:serine/threonine protein kinase